MLERFKKKVERKLEEQREQEEKSKLTETILNGEFPQIKVEEKEIAEIIVEWCYKEQKPIIYFIECLEAMGIEGISTLKQLKKEKNVNFVTLKTKDKTWQLLISTYPKEYLKLKNDDMEITYEVWLRKTTYKENKKEEDEWD